MSKQEIESRLLALGAQQVALPSLRKYVAYQLSTMRQDQYILVGRNGALRTGSIARTSLALKAENFIKLLENRVAQTPQNAWQASVVKLY